MWLMSKKSGTSLLTERHHLCFAALRVFLNSPSPTVVETRGRWSPAATTVRHVKFKYALLSPVLGHEKGVHGRTGLRSCRGEKVANPGREGEQKRGGERDPVSTTLILVLIIAAIIS